MSSYGTAGGSGEWAAAGVPARSGPERCPDRVRAVRRESKRPLVASCFSAALSTALQLGAVSLAL